eukprot:5067254-Pyramimonas_sp.AAC.1
MPAVAQRGQKFSARGGRQGVRQACAKKRWAPRESRPPWARRGVSDFLGWSGCAPQGQALLVDGPSPACT